MISRSLAVLARHGAGVMASGLGIGLAVPTLAASLHPLLAPAIFVLTATMMLTIDWRSLVEHVRRPGRLALILGWMLLAIPVLCDAAAHLAGLPAPLTRSLVIWGAGPSMTSAPALALLFELDSALALLVMVTGTLLMPFTLPPLVLGLIGIGLGIGMVPLMTRLVLFIGGAALAAALVGRLAGTSWLHRNAVALRGVNVLILLVFAIAVMDGVRDIFLARPGQLLLYLAVATAASLVLQGLTMAAFLRLGRRTAVTLAICGGNKNLAVVWAALGAAAPPELTLLFIAVQMPFYLLPATLGGLYRRLGARRG